MTTPPKVTLVTCSSMPHLFPGEEGLLDELASRGCEITEKICYRNAVAFLRRVQEG